MELSVEVSEKQQQLGQQFFCPEDKSGVVRLFGSHRGASALIVFCIGAFLLGPRLNIVFYLSVCIFGLVHVFLQRCLLRKR